LYMSPNWPWHMPHCGSVATACAHQNINAARLSCVRAVAGPPQNRSGRVGRGLGRLPARTALSRGRGISGPLAPDPPPAPYAPAAGAGAAAAEDTEEEEKGEKEEESGRGAAHLAVRPVPDGDLVLRENRRRHVTVRKRVRSELLQQLRIHLLLLRVAPERRERLSEVQPVLRLKVVMPHRVDQVPLPRAAPRQQRAAGPGGARPHTRRARTSAVPPRSAGRRADLGLLHVPCSVEQLPW
jgi:hypothetical protein